MKTVDRNRTPGTTSSLLHSAARYDFLVWLVTLGRERVLREEVLRLAGLEPGESVLDVGCGTGTLAIAAKRHVGPKGTVYGVDASPEMIGRAARKARKAGVEVGFRNGVAEALPFPDAQFDAVLTTLMRPRCGDAGSREPCEGTMQHDTRRCLAVTGEQGKDLGEQGRASQR
jgi:ubiquinone/menaquinone biosynthesis C-methylase UbiE